MQKEIHENSLLPEGTRPRSKSRLSMRRDSLRRHQDARESDVYARWINWKVQLAGFPLPPVEDLAVDLKDGQHLGALCKLFTGKHPRLRTKFSSKFQYVENIEVVLLTLKRQGWPGDVGGAPFVDGDLDKILAYLWQLIMCEQKLGHRDSVGDGGGKREIWKWAERYLEGDHADVHAGRLSNGVAEWSDGSVLAYLVHKAVPTLDLDTRRQFGDDVEAWIDHVLDVAERKAHVPRLISPAHLTDEQTDDKPLATYLFAFRESVEPAAANLVTPEHFQRDAEEFQLYVRSDLATVIDAARKVKLLQGTWEAAGSHAVAGGHTYADVQEWMTRYAEEEAARGFEEKERRRLLRLQAAQEEEAIRNAREIEMKQADKARRLREQQEIELRALEERRRKSELAELQAQELLERNKSEFEQEPRIREIEEARMAEELRLQEAQQLEDDRLALEAERLLREEQLAEKQREIERQVLEEAERARAEREHLERVRHERESALREQQSALERERAERDVQLAEKQAAIELESRRLEEEREKARAWKSEQEELERQRLLKDEELARRQAEMDLEAQRLQKERELAEKQRELEALQKEATIESEADRLRREHREEMERMKALLEERDRQLAQQQATVSSPAVPLEQLRALLAEEREVNDRKFAEQAKQMNDQMEKLGKRISDHRIADVRSGSSGHVENLQDRASDAEKIFRCLAQVEKEIVRAKTNMKGLPAMIQKIRECPGDGAVQLSASLDYDNSRLQHKLHRINGAKVKLLDNMQEGGSAKHRKHMKRILKQMRNFVDDYEEVMDNLRLAQPHLRQKRGDRYKRQRTHLWIHRAGNPIPQHLMVTTNKPSSMNYRRHISIDARKEFYAPVKSSAGATAPSNYVNSLFALTHELADQRELYESGESESFDSSALIDTPEIYEKDGSLYFPPGELILEGHLLSHDRRYYAFLFSGALLCTKRKQDSKFELVLKIRLDAHSQVGAYEEISFLISGKRKERVFVCESREIANSWISHLNATLKILRGEAL